MKPAPEDRHRRDVPRRRRTDRGVTPPAPVSGDTGAERGSPHERLQPEPGDACTPPSASIAVIRPSSITNASTATGTPSSVATKPARPSTIAGCATRVPAKKRALDATACAPSQHPQRAAALVGAQHHVGIEHREQPLEVAARARPPGTRRRSRGRRWAPRGRRPARAAAPATRADAPRPASGRRSARCRRTAPRTGRAGRTPGAPPAATSPARRAARRRPRRPPAPRPRGRARGVITGSGSRPSSSASSRRRLARVEHRQAHARDDRRQPAAQVLDVARVGAVEPQPRLLQRVVGLRLRAQHARGDRVQMRRCASNSSISSHPRDSVGQAHDRRRSTDVTRSACPMLMTARMTNPAFAVEGAMDALQAVSKSVSARPAADQPRARAPARQPDQRLRRVRGHARPRSPQVRGERGARVGRRRLARDALLQRRRARGARAHRGAHAARRTAPSRSPTTSGRPPPSTSTRRSSARSCSTSRTSTCGTG